MFIEDQVRPKARGIFLMPLSYFQALAASISLITMAGCADVLHDSELTTSNTELEQKVQLLQAENQQLEKKLITDNMETKQTKTEPKAISEFRHTNTASFTDVDGVDGVQDIMDLAKLGVLDTNGGKFEPGKPITRAQYVCWLIAANNIYFADTPKNFIHPANENTTASFIDVPASHPNFRCIQGLEDAGYRVGIDAKHFAPDQPITREQMIAIKAQIDEGSPIISESELRASIHVSDCDAIDDAYLGPIHEDYSVKTSNNIARIWGNTKVLHPKQWLTRAEAAMSLSKIGSVGDRHATVAECLTKKNS
jgi:S-layer homology domain